jgi:hypothetical protein
LLLGSVFAYNIGTTDLTFGTEPEGQRSGRTEVGQPGLTTLWAVN